jgi:hypothetical protein
MEKFPKIRFILITVLVITAINLIALGTILRYSFHRDRDRGTEERKGPSSHGFQYMKDKLELTSAQEVQFKTAGEAFFASINGTFEELEKQRIEMIKELGKSHPDTVVLYKIADHMGTLHAQIKRNVVSHMLKLRTFCTPVQIPLLDSMYNELIRTESPWRQKHRSERHGDKDSYRSDDHTKK